MTPPRDSDNASTEDPGVDEQQRAELRQRLVRRLREGEVADVDVDAEHDQRDWPDTLSSVRLIWSRFSGPGL
jgi:hypothetical protein